MDCRPIDIVKDMGFANILKTENLNRFYNPQSRETVPIKIPELYKTIKEAKLQGVLLW